MRAGMTCLAIAFTISAGAGPASAQTIDPGMTRDQVVERLGQPASERARGQFTYLFYINGCERRCGMSDVVTLENDAVVDAIFRKAGRGYSGASSSPAGVSPEPTRGGAEGGGMDARAASDASGGAAGDAGAAGAGGGGIVIGKPATPAATPTPPGAERATPAPAPATVGGVSVQPAPGPSVFSGQKVNPETRPAQPNDTTIRDAGTLRQGGPVNPKPGDVLSPADSAQLRRIRGQQQADTTRPPEE